MEPHNHRVNAAKRAIQTFKNHLIRGFCCTDSEWTLQLWNNLTKRAMITLNLCRTSRNIRTSRRATLFYGQRHDWNKHPMAPPGAGAVVYEAPAGNTSWGTRGVDGWYFGPAFDNYRNMRFCIPETKAYQTSASYDLFQQYCQLPTLSDQQHNMEVAKEWIESIQRLKNKPKKTAIKDLKKQSTK